MQYLKIDGGFVRDMVENRISESMVAAIAQVAHVMQLDTIAEFVESEAIKERLIKLGVDYAQGFAIGKPIPLIELLKTLQADLPQSDERHEAEEALIPAPQ